MSRGHEVGLTFVKLEAKNRLDLNAYSPRKSPRPKVPISLDFASRPRNNFVCSSQYMHGARSTGEKVHKSSRILHALLKKTCKTGGCLLKISDQDLPQFGKIFRARACTTKSPIRPDLPYTIWPNCLFASIASAKLPIRLD